MHPGGHSVSLSGVWKGTSLVAQATQAIILDLGIPTRVLPFLTGHYKFPTSYSLFPSNAFSMFDKRSLLLMSRRTQELITLFL